MKNIFFILITLFVLNSCANNDYLIDGGIAKANVGMTTFDFLKSNKQLDTLALLIDRAKMVEVVNAKSTTLFATNNLSIRNYVNAILAEKRKTDPTAKFTINDIPDSQLKIMLGAYIFDQELDRSKLIKEGKVYISINGAERLLSLEPTQDFTGQLDNFPEYVYYTFKVGASWDPTDQVIDDKKAVVRTSNIISTNGVIHVLQGNHIFSNYIPN